MKRFAVLLCLLFVIAIALPAQTASTQYQHIGYTWNQGAVLTSCLAGATAPTSCVKDYALTLTDPAGKVQPLISFAYPATSYAYGPGGFLYCGNWQASLVIEYFDDKGAPQSTGASVTTTAVACPFVPSPPNTLKGTPAA